MPDDSFVPEQVPDEHVSAVVQGLPSVHVFVSSFVETHVPLLQESSVQSLPSVQVFVSSFVKTQMPLLQVSSVHASPSSQ